MKDSLYCCNIYQQFALSPLTRNRQDKIGELKDSLFSCDLLSNSVKQYLEDACRVFNLNIFKVELYEFSRPKQTDETLVTQGDDSTKPVLTGKQEPELDES